MKVDELKDIIVRPSNNKYDIFSYYVRHPFVKRVFKQEKDSRYVKREDLPRVLARISRMILTQTRRENNGTQSK